jgi:hypothetical protein
MSRRVGVYDFLTAVSVILFLLCALVDSAVFLLSMNEMMWLTENLICWILCCK